MISRIVLNQILKQLSKLQHGVLTMQFPDGKKMEFGAVGLGPNATLKIHSESVFFDLALGGDIAFAEAFMQGKWETDNLTALIKLFLLNKMNSDIQPKFSGINFLKKIVNSLYKLSEALLNIEKENEACDILNQFIIKFPNHKLIEKTKFKINEIQCN